MTWYFRKELPDSPIFIEGIHMRFDILATDDERLANHLLNATAKRIGGVLSINQDEYDDLVKKKAQSQPSLAPRKPQREEVRQRHGQTLTRKRKGAGLAVEADGKPDQSQQVVVPQSLEAFKPKPQRGVLA
jgi:hypothetical protein